MKAKINELETNSKNKNIGGLVEVSTTVRRVTGLKLT
jgi:hypothetical protein